LRLVTSQGTRARRGEEELAGGDPVARTALDALVRGRLVVAHQAEAGSAYEIAHEVLVKGWPRLRRWLLEDEEGRILRERIAQAAAEWERLGRARDALWNPRQLAEAGERDPPDLNPREAEFLSASRGAARRRRWARRAAIAGVPLLVVLVYMAVELKARSEIRRRVDAHVGDATAALAEARAKDAQAGELRKKAFAHFDKGEIDRGEELWARVLALETEAARAYLRGGQALEAGLAQDPNRSDVRNLLADALYDRALLEERARRFQQRDELVQRMSLYDEDGARMRRWNAPAVVTIDTEPPGAAVTLYRYVNLGGKLREERVRDLGRTPVAQTELPQGSYLFTFDLKDRFPVRYPVLLGRAERFPIRVDLPPAAAVPKGFVYVPAGRFLFGSAADEEVRRGFFETVPLHDVWTGAYLIGQTEVTFADWLEYLRGLEPSERAARAPRVTREIRTESLRLEELPSGSWRLAVQPAKLLLTARIGEALTYPGRTRRAAQDWLRLPVSAISARDAETYLDWLKRTGRVPGARLCEEREWERGARGADDRPFPHGYRLDPEDANFDETYGKDPLGMGPDEVGSHIISRSPYGLDDMSGNAWEWTTSSLRPGGYVIRGGSYFFGRKTNQVVNRQVPVPTLKDVNLGLRVCAVVPSNPGSAVTP
jgi:formylglycine-generating enzyme required for sulfatase activity